MDLDWFITFESKINKLLRGFHFGKFDLLIVLPIVSFRDSPTWRKVNDQQRKVRKEEALIILEPIESIFKLTKNYCNAFHVLFVNKENRRVSLQK